MREITRIVALLGLLVASNAVAAEPPPLKLGGWAEVYYQKNLNTPSNRVTANRAFDDRDDVPTLANIVADAQLDWMNVVGRLTLQIGATPDSYYAAEPGNTNLWKHFQQAYAGYRVGALHDLILTAGIFLSPVGAETLTVHENWNWSRSNLFYAVPAYHSGLRATLPIDARWSATLAGYTGWNTVEDNNNEKSVETHVTYARDGFTATLLYFGGVERPAGAPEGRAWRHLFDVNATWKPLAWLEMLAHLDAGFEPNHFGTSDWAAGALYARFRLLEPLHFAVRGDLFFQRTAESAEGRATPIFWDGSNLASVTETLELRPFETFSIRLEHRHDQATGPVYFGGAVARDGEGSPIANRRSQDTVTVGATAWF